MGILKAVLVILLVYYLLRLLARLFAPKIFAYAVRKTEERFKDQFGGYQSYEEHENKVGDVSVDKAPPKKRDTSSEVGEYIDFEELANNHIPEYLL